MLTDQGLKRQVRELEPGREHEIEVGGAEGLRLRVKASGSTAWTLRYRTTTGQRRITLGRYPAMSLSSARTKARKMGGKIADGADPSAERKAERKALRVVDLFGKTDLKDEKKDKVPGWYLGKYVKTAGRLGPAKTAESIRTDRVYIIKHLRSRKVLMRKRLDAVTVADLERIKAEMTPGAWRKVRNILRVAFRHAEETGVIPPGSNPAARVKATADKKVERYLSPDERRRLNDALDRAQKIGPAMKDEKRGTKGGLAPSYVRLFRLLALTGMRLGEALDLQWQWIDWRHGQLRLPTSKTGAKSVPLTPQAVEFLRSERKSVDRIGRVCGTHDGGRLDVHNVQRAWRSLRANAKVEDLRIHDLRHSWASDAASAGVSLPIIGAVLGHRSPQTTHRYAHIHDRAIRDGLRTTGDAIAKATGV